MDTEKNVTTTVHEETSVTTQPTLSSPIELLKKVFEAFKRSFRRIVPILIVTFISSALYTVVMYGTDPVAKGIASVLNVCILFISYIALVVAIVSEHSETSDFTMFYQKAWKLLWAYIIVSLLVGLSSIGGFVLLVIPGFIVTLYLAFSVFTFVAEDTREMQALIRSWYYVRGNFLKVFIRYCTIVLLLAAISMVVGIIGAIFNVSIFADKKTLVEALLSDAFNTFIISPVTLLFLFELYKELKEQKETLPGEKEEAQIKKGLKTLIIIGVVGCIFAVALAAFFISTTPFSELQRAL